LSSSWAASRCLQGWRFTDKPFRLITQEDVEIAIAAKRQRTTTMMRKGEKTWTRVTGGDVAANRTQAHLSALWNWAIQPKRAYAEKTPFSYGGRVPDELKKTKEHGRDRRLHPGEEEGLLKHAGQHLHDCIVAALETGMRKNEMLSLQWRHVRWLQNELAIEWQNAKTKHSRQIPISPTMREVLVRRQKAHPKDQEWKPEHYVFGNEIGGRVKDIRTAWDNAVLKAHGVKVVRGHAGRVSAENRAKHGRLI
jgi:integrase